LDETTRLWDLKDPAVEPKVLRGHDGPILAVAISPDNRWLVTGSWDKTARLWDLKDPAAEPKLLRGHDDAISAVAISPDNRWLVTGSWDKTARRWDLKDRLPNPSSSEATMVPSRPLPSARQSLAGYRQYG